MHICIIVNAYVSYFTQIMRFRIKWFRGNTGEIYELPEIEY